jgi:N-acetyl-anhydromuramyl-L-alanine amidase AmpD
MRNQSLNLKRVLMLTMSGDDVKLMQTKLKKYGLFRDRIDGYFGQNTLVAVTNFQREAGLRPDGVVGTQTWGNLMIWDEIRNPKEKVEAESNKLKDIPNKVSYIHHNGLIIYDNLLSDDEYVKKETQKNTIWLHHTAGGSRPDWTIGGWEKDFQKDKDGNPILDKNGNPKPLKVGSHFVIGRKSSSCDDSLWDGKVLKAIDDIYWAYHLGISDKKNEDLNSKSISIEICNYGPLTQKKDGRFFNCVNKPVSDDDVVELETPFRGYKYWERYTDAQIESLRKLILFLKERWNIEIERGIYNEDWFNYDEKWFGLGGLRSHSQVEIDKYDIFPQPELIQMLNTL